MEDNGYAVMRRLFRCRPLLLCCALLPLTSCIISLPLYQEADCEDVTDEYLPKGKGHAVYDYRLVKDMNLYKSHGRGVFVILVPLGKDRSNTPLLDNYDKKGIVPKNTRLRIVKVRKVTFHYAEDTEGTILHEESVAHFLEGELDDTAKTHFSFSSDLMLEGKDGIEAINPECIEKIGTGH